MKHLAINQLKVDKGFRESILRQGKEEDCYVDCESVYRAEYGVTLLEDHGNREYKNSFNKKGKFVDSMLS